MLYLKSMLKSKNTQHLLYMYAIGELITPCLTIVPVGKLVMNYVTSSGMHPWHNHLYQNGTNCNVTTEEELKKCRVKIKPHVLFVCFLM